MASNEQEIAARPSAQERNIRGPPCNRCMINSGVPMCLVRDRLTIPERNLHARPPPFDSTHLPHMLAKHPVWASHALVEICLPRSLDIGWSHLGTSHYRMSVGAVRFQQCRCGYCDPFWLSCGWRCWGWCRSNCIWPLKNFMQLSSSSFRSRSMGATRKPWDDANGFLMMISLQLWPNVDISWELAKERGNL